METGRIRKKASPLKTKSRITFVSIIKMYLFVTGIVGPWYIDKTSTGSFLLADGIVGEKKGIFEVVEEGLYFIYAQVRKT